jgi:hypothetical protein
VPAVLIFAIFARTFWAFSNQFPYFAMMVPPLYG